MQQRPRHMKSRAARLRRAMRVEDQGGARFGFACCGGMGPDGSIAGEELVIALTSETACDILGFSSLLENLLERDYSSAQAFVLELARHPDTSIRRLAAQYACQTHDSALALASDRALDVRLSLLANEQALGFLTAQELLAATGGDTESILQALESLRWGLANGGIEAKSCPAYEARFSAFESFLESLGQNPDPQVILQVRELKADFLEEHRPQVRALKEGAPAEGSIAAAAGASAHRKEILKRRQSLRRARLEKKARLLSALSDTSAGSIVCVLGFLKPAGAGEPLAIDRTRPFIVLDDEAVCECLSSFEDEPGLASVMLRLAEHPSSKVRAAVASGDMPREAFERLASDASSSVRRELLENHALTSIAAPDEVLSLVGDDPTMLDAFCSSRGFDGEEDACFDEVSRRLREKFSDSPDAMVRKALAWIEPDE